MFFIYLQNGHSLALPVCSSGVIMTGDIADSPVIE